MPDFKKVNPVAMPYRGRAARYKSSILGAPHGTKQQKVAAFR